MTAPARKVCVVAAGRSGADDPTSAVVVRSIDDVASAAGWRGSVDDAALPAIVRAFGAGAGFDAVFAMPLSAARAATGAAGTHGEGNTRDVEGRAWLWSSHACGWVEPAPGGWPALDATIVAIDDALGRGFVGADAVLLGCAGRALPRLSWDDDRAFAPIPPMVDERPIGLYAIVGRAAKVAAAFEAGIHTVQLRIKRPRDADARWDAQLRDEAAEATRIARDAGGELVMNDHWRLAADLCIDAVHLGQEDIAALGAEGRATLAASGVRLGISSHSVWELCRARSLTTRYVACGPVWPTTTKDMPWIPQGPGNLGWWCANAGRPVVAIGGILAPRQARIASRAGADGICLVRALEPDAAAVVPAYRDAWQRGRAERSTPSPAFADTLDATTVRTWPHPTLD